jgi:hypothetical protein
MPLLQAEEWLITLTRTLRQELPRPRYFISHAPIAPWFQDDGESYPGGAYREIHNQVGHLIDWVSQLKKGNETAVAHS